MPQQCDVKLSTLWQYFFRVCLSCFLSISNEHTVYSVHTGITSIENIIPLSLSQNNMTILSWSLLKPDEFRIPRFASSISYYQQFAATKFMNLNSNASRLACVVKYYGVGLEFVKNTQRVLSPIEYFGLATMTTDITTDINCFYLTNKGFLSDKQDDPKTLGLMVYCPVLDQSRKLCTQLLYESISSVRLDLTGYYSSVTTTVNVTLRSPASRYSSKAPLLHHKRQASTHAVCTVQTFRNPLTGPMLYLFAKYYLTMGWSVIVYDRHGWHHDFLKPFERNYRMKYYPYTAFELLFPETYQLHKASVQKGVVRYHSKHTVNEKGSPGILKNIDTANADSDKEKTWDFARLEHTNVISFAYIDADELLFCPEAAGSLISQRTHQQQLMNRLVNKTKAQEVRVLRRNYDINSRYIDEMSWDPSLPDRVNKSHVVLRLQECILKAFATKSIALMLDCFSPRCLYEPLPKSIDIHGVCPFHWNHESCAMKAYMKFNNCQCKDVIMTTYPPMPSQCHLMHLNVLSYDRLSKQRDLCGNLAADFHINTTKNLAAYMFNGRQRLHTPNMARV